MPLTKQITHYFDEPLAQTNSSLHINLSAQKVDPHSFKIASSKTKKRIGPYSYYLNDVIGSGFSSIVYKGIKDKDKTVLYAIKMIKIDKTAEFQKSVLLENEIEILKTIHHENILAFHELFYTANHCYIITQYCEGGSLLNLINLLKQNSSENQPKLNEILYQVCKGCEYLSSKSIIHRDIKPANIFLKGQTWKIGDFGFAKILENEHVIQVEKYNIGSPIFMPYQTLLFNEYSAKTDSYALGVLLYFAFTKKYPYPCKHKKQLVSIYKKIQKQKYHHTFEENLLFSQLPNQIKTFIQRLLHIDAQKRYHLSADLINYEEIFLQKEYNFIKKINHFEQQNIEIKKNIKITEILSIHMKSMIKQQVILCQFIYNYLNNLNKFLIGNANVVRLICKNLQYFMKTFEWEGNNKNLQEFKHKYETVILEQKGQTFEKAEGKTEDSQYEFFFELESQLEKAIKQLVSYTKQNQQCAMIQLGLQKTLEYHLFVSTLLKQESILQTLTSLKEIVGNLVLHVNFTSIKPNLEKIEALLFNFSTSKP